MPKNKKGPARITVNHVSKTFKLPHEKSNSIKSAVLNFYRRKKGYEIQEALKDISFEVYDGEFFGIVGKNGSGKSTLLKLLAGIYTPTNGNAIINGRLTPFIELGVGFNPELTGRENVFLNGALLGFSRKVMTAMYDDIVSFAELERFMDQKLKNYSSGMQVRLAFSIAIRAKSDILLIDEVLAVGDTAFQRKCYEHFVKLKKQGTTVILVTHDMGAVERFCDRALVIDKGINKGCYSPRDAAVLYEKLNAGPQTLANKDTKNQKNRWGSGLVRLKNIEIEQEGIAFNKDVQIKQGRDLNIFLTFKSDKIRDIVVGLALYDEFGVNISGPNSIGHKFNTDSKVNFHIEKVPMNPGKYFLTIAVFDEDVVDEYDHIEKAAVITIISDNKQQFGKVNLFGEWQKAKS